MVRCIGSLLFLREGDHERMRGTEEIESVDWHWTISVCKWNTLNVLGKLPPGGGKKKYLEFLFSRATSSSIAYKGVGPYPLQVGGRGPWRYGLVHLCTAV